MLNLGKITLEFAADKRQGDQYQIEISHFRYMVQKMQGEA